MIEDVVVFGGLKNMIDGLVNFYVLYKFKMIVFCIICMVEVIGDDLGLFIINFKNEGVVF